MTRHYLVAGVAALAIAASAGARPGEHGGGAGPRVQAVQPHGGGGGGAMRAQAFQAPRAERQAFQAPRAERQAFAAPRAERQAFAAPRMQREQRTAAIQRPQRAERMSMSARPARENRVQQAQTMRASRVQQAQAMRSNRVQQAESRQQLRANRVQQAQGQRADHLQQAQTRMAQQQQLRANRQQQVQAQIAQRQQLRSDRMSNIVNTRVAANQGAGYGVGGCPPGLANKNCMPPGQAAKLGLGGSTPLITAANMAALRNAQVDTINARYGTRMVAPALAASLIGAPISIAPSVLGMGLSPIPQSISYLYPETPQYYYQYGDGYVYQVDRTSSLISALLPLLGGGYMPGSYLPASYMSSYAPDYYGLNSFYPADYGYDTTGYYGNMCNRYANGVIYQVDCMTGMVENVIPMYAGGYGVGQMLPSSYDYYNVPTQYRSIYPASSNYWYAPGAIYQYDPTSSLITSVAALLSPGLTVGQPLPMGYGAYNVPTAYRATYYDTPTAWYRYNNGYIYQVDPTTQLVSAIVASALT